MAVQDQGINDRCRFWGSKSVAQCWERVTAELFFEQSEVVASIEGNDWVALRHVRCQCRCHFFEDFFDGSPMAACVLGGNAVDLCGCIRDIDTRIS